MPKEATFARQFQNYFGMQYGDVKAHGFKTVVKTDAATAKELHDLSLNYVGAYAERAGVDAARGVGVHLENFIERPRVQAALKKETFNFLRAVDRTTRTRLADTLAAGNKDGETVDQLARRTKEVLGFDPDAEVYVPRDLTDDTTKLANWRAERIARSESAQAMTVGERAGWTESEVVTGLEWVAASDACAFCMELDGVVVPLDGGLFFRLGDSMTVTDTKGKAHTMSFNYRDIEGAPLHPNCRCALKAQLSPEYR